MNKPRGIQWLESQTGEELSESLRTEAPDSRHFSVRISTSLFAALSDLAAARGESVSQTARRLLREGVTRADHPERAAIDAAINALERLKLERT